MYTQTLTLLLLTTLPALITAQAHGSPYYPPERLPPTPPFKPSPLPREPESTPGDIYICKSAGFTGTCEYIRSLTYQCNTLPAQYQRALTSIRPDKGQTCLVYDQESCMGKAEWLRWPGSGNLRGRGWDNRIVSWRCSEDKCDGVQQPGGCTKNKDGSLKNP